MEHGFRVSDRHKESNDSGEVSPAVVLGDTETTVRGISSRALNARQRGRARAWGQRGRTTMELAEVVLFVTRALDISKTGEKKPTTTTTADVAVQTTNGGWVSH